MNSFEEALRRLPSPILDKLQAMIRRVRWLLALRGFFATLSVALACLLGIMAVDATVTLFSPAARWGLSLVGLSLTLAAAWWFLVRPLSRRFTLTKMARILEIRRPELQERISTAVELLASDDPDSIRGSQELIEAVVDSAIEDVEGVDPHLEFKPVRSKKFIVATALGLGIVALLLAIWPTQSWRLMTRAMVPFLDLGNAYADRLVVDPGDARIGRGTPLTMKLAVKHKHLDRAEIRRLLPDGTESVERMAFLSEEADGTRHFALTFPAVEADFAYRVRAGAALSRYYEVTTVEPPSIEEIAVRYEYPSYTALPPREVLAESAEIRAVAHSQVRLSTTLSSSVQSAKLVFNEQTTPAAAHIEGNRVTWDFELRPELQGYWHLEFTDEEGFANLPERYGSEVLPDKVPTVQILAPVQREIRLKPTERLPIDLGVIEDFGFGGVALLVTPEGGELREIPQALPLATNEIASYTARALLDLPALKLAPEETRLALQVRVHDNRPSEYEGPGIGLSETLFVTIDSQAKNLADQVIEAQRKEVEQQIREVQQELQRALDEIRRAEQELIRDKEINSNAREKLKEFSRRNDRARDALEEIATLLDTSLFQAQSQEAAKLAREPLAKAQESADMIPMTDAQHERVEGAQEAKKNIAQALEGLAELSKSMNEVNEDYATISKLNDLANRQQEIAMNAEDWAKRAEENAAAAQAAAEAAEDEAAKQEAMQQFRQEQQREKKKFQTEQEKIAQQLGELLKRNAAALAEVLEQQKEESEALSEQAAALAQEQADLRKLSEEVTAQGEKGQEQLREALIAQLAQKQSELAAQTKHVAARARESFSASESDAEGAKSEATKGEAADRSTPSASEVETLAEAATEAEKAAARLAEKELDTAVVAASEASEALAQVAAQASETSASKASPEGQAPETSTETTPESSAPSEPASESSASQESSMASAENPASDPAMEQAAAPTMSQSEALAARQEALVEQIRAVQEGRLQEALAQMESLLGEEASALESEAKSLANTLKNLQQNQARSNLAAGQKSLLQGEQKADQAARQLERAQKEQAQAEAKGNLEAGELANTARVTMERGQREQEQSARALAEASTAFAATSSEIGQTLEGLEPSDMDERLTKSEDLAEGFQEVSQSAQSQSADEAAQQSQDAAKTLQQLAQEAMQKLGKPGAGQPQADPNGQQTAPTGQELTGDPDSPGLNETGKKTADTLGDGVPPELSRLGITGADWVRFKGALSGGSASAIESELPAEYRELVGRYFQVIAKEAEKGK